MDLENQVKESPLEKAKRLKAEKEAKDQVKAEDEANKQAEAQAKAEKLGVLSGSKQDLENKLKEINAKIEASRSEAHETRDIMKDGDLDKDEDFKEEYGSTISEVAGNLNELRNERNSIKAELEQINSDIENFEVNEVIAEGQEALRGKIKNINQENEEAVAQIKDYPGAEAGDIEDAKRITDETNKEVAEVVEGVESGTRGIVGEKTSSEGLKDEEKKESFEDISKSMEEIADNIFNEVNSELNSLVNEANNFKGNADDYYRVRNALQFKQYELSPIQMTLGGPRDSHPKAGILYKSLNSRLNKIPFTDWKKLEDSILEQHTAIFKKSKETLDAFDKKWDGKF